MNTNVVVMPGNNLSTEKVAPSNNLSTEEVSKAADELDEALLDEHKTSLNKAEAIIKPLMKLVKHGALKKLKDINSFKQYYEKRLAKHEISRSSFYRYKDASEFCHSNSVEFTDKSAPSVMAIIKAWNKDRKRIWDELEKLHGQIPTSSMIVEAIKSERINTNPDKSLKKATTNAAQVVFEKLIENSINLHNVLPQIRSRTEALEADTCGIEVLSAEDLSNLESLVTHGLMLANDSSTITAKAA